MIEYAPEEVGNSQYIQIYIEDLNNNMNEPVESFYITETKRRTLEFTVAGRPNGKI